MGSEMCIRDRPVIAVKPLLLQYLFDGGKRLGVVGMALIFSLPQNSGLDHAGLFPCVVSSCMLDASENCGANEQLYRVLKI